MTRQAQVLALVRSFAERDDSRFETVALQVAQDAANAGRSKMAEQIRLLIKEARERANPAITSVGGPIPLVRPKGELAGLLSVHYPLTRFDNLVLDRGTRDRLGRIVDEHRNREKLARHGLKPRRKFLLVGPPGTGKTMSAAALAGELGLPLFTILLDGVINRYMGETSSKIRLVFEAMKENRGVYFFDEVDALATKRLIENDVGEARRTLNSILQMLDEDDSDALIIAATNHSELLDPAMFRRFDVSVTYALPPHDLIRQVFLNALSPFDLGQIDWSLVERNSEGLSQAELVRIAEDAARDAVLNNDAVIDTPILAGAIRQRTGEIVS